MKHTHACHLEKLKNGVWGCKGCNNDPVFIGWKLNPNIPDNEIIFVPKDLKFKKVKQ